MSAQTRRWLAPGIIAVAGLAVGVAIAVTAPADQDDPLAESRSTKQYEANMERIGGKSTVFSYELEEWLGSLFHGARLGYTIGVSSLLVAWLTLVFTRKDDSST